VGEPFYLFRKQSDPQVGRDKANHGGLSVGLLQDSWGETRFPAGINYPLVPARIGSFGHADKKHRFQIR
jgi:hypothetical protein